MNETAFIDTKAVYKDTAQKSKKQKKCLATKEKLYQGLRSGPLEFNENNKCGHFIAVQVVFDFRLFPRKHHRISCDFFVTMT